MVVLKEHLVRRIRSAIRGPEKYGIMMPQTVLAASLPHGDLPRFGLATLLPRKGLENRVNRISGKMGMGKISTPSQLPVKDFTKTGIARPELPDHGCSEAASARQLNHYATPPDEIAQGTSTQLNLVGNQQAKTPPPADISEKSIEQQFGDQVATDEDRKKDLEKVSNTPVKIQTLKATNPDDWPFTGSITVLGEWSLCFANGH